MKLPTVESLGARPIPQPSEGIARFNPSTGAEGAVAQATHNFGSSLQVDAGELANLQHQQDTLWAEDQTNKIKAKRIDLTVGKDGFANIVGNDAITKDLPTQYGGQLDSYINELSGTANNANQRELLRRRGELEKLSLNESIQQHQLQQSKVAEKDTFENARNLAFQDISTSPNNPLKFSTNVTRLSGIIDNLHQDQEAKDFLKSKVLSDAHISNIESSVAAGDVKGAKDWFQMNRTSIDPSDQLKIMHMLKSHDLEQASEARITLQENMQNAAAMANDGVLPTNYLDPKIVDQAYPDNPAKAQQFKQKITGLNTFSNGVASLKNRDNDSLIKFVTEQNKPTATNPDNYAAQSQYQSSYAQKAQDILSQRFKAPMEYAEGNNIGKVNPLNVQDPAKFGEEMKNRQDIASTMTDRFNSPNILLKQSEASALTGLLDKMPASQKIEYFRALATNVTDPKSYDSVMQQIRPDSPATAAIGKLMKKVDTVDPALLPPGMTAIPSTPQLVTSSHWFGPDETISPQYAATRMAEGEDMLNPTKLDKNSDGKPKIPMPHENDLKAKWASTVNDAYRGDWESENAAYQNYKNFYAGEMLAGKGRRDGSLDSDLADRAVKASTGGVIGFNGRNVVKPWGMSDDEFSSKVKSAWPDVAKRYGREDLKVDNVILNGGKDGVYIATSGSGPLYGKDGQPISFSVK